MTSLLMPAQSSAHSLSSTNECIFKLCRMDTCQQSQSAGAKFAVDVKDTRFGALFTSPDFALDPTDPRYKATEGAKSIQKEAMSRRETGTAQKQLSNGPGKKPHATVKGMLFLKRSIMPLSCCQGKRGLDEMLTFSEPTLDFYRVIQDLCR